MPKYFHYISHLRWVFYIWGMYLIFSQGYYQSEDSLSEIGLGIYMMGISLAVGSLSNTGKLSEREKKFFANPKKIKRYTFSILFGAGSSFLVGLFFILLETINPNLEALRAEQYANLGYGCWAMALGIVFELKQTYDKKLIYQQQSIPTPIVEETTLNIKSSN